MRPSLIAMILSVLGASAAAQGPRLPVALASAEVRAATDTGLRIRVLAPAGWPGRVVARNGEGLVLAAQRGTIPFHLDLSGLEPASLVDATVQYQSASGEWTGGVAVQGYTTLGRFSMQPELRGGQMLDPRRFVQGHAWDVLMAMAVSIEAADDQAARALLRAALRSAARRQQEEIIDLARREEQRGPVIR